MKFKHASRMQPGLGLESRVRLGKAMGPSPLLRSEQSLEPPPLHPVGPRPSSEGQVGWARPADFSSHTFEQMLRTCGVSGESRRETESRGETPLRRLSQKEASDPLVKWTVRQACPRKIKTLFDVFWHEYSMLHMAK